MRIILTTTEKINGYWDFGAKDTFEFEATDLKDGNVKWECWQANFWFNTAKGKTDKLTLSYGVKRLKAIFKLAKKIKTIKTELS